MTKEELMRRAIALAVENVANGGGPFGAVIAKDGEIVAEGVNRVTANHDPTAHAEVSAIRSACQKLHTFDPMCLGAIYWAHLDRIYYGANQHDAAQINFDDAFIYEELAVPVEERQKQMLRLLPTEALAAFEAWREKADKVEY